MKKNLFVLFILLFNQALFSQENTELDEEIDEIIENLISLDDDTLIDLINDLNKYQIIYTSVNYNTKAYFLGRDLGIDQYTISSQVMYENSNGIYLGVSGNFYSKFDPKWDITTLTAGYGKNFGKEKNIRLELGYSRYIFSDSDSNDFENSIDGGFYMSTPNGHLGSSISSSYLFGEKTGFQSTLSIYGDIKLFNINSKNNSKVNFEPDLSFQFASENIDTSRFDNLGIDLPFINRIVDSFETFSLRNIQLQLPLIFEVGDFQIEAGYNINFPSAFDFEDSVSNTSFFNIGVSYIFNLK